MGFHTSGAQEFPSVIPRGRALLRYTDTAHRNFPEIHTEFTQNSLTPKPDCIRNKQKTRDRGGMGAQQQLLGDFSGSRGNKECQERHP